MAGEGDDPSLAESMNRAFWSEANTTRRRWRSMPRR